jgi:hypothetical protein
MFSVGNGSWLVKTLLKSFTDQRPWCGMMTASACMDFKE